MRCAALACVVLLTGCSDRDALPPESTFIQLGTSGADEALALVAAHDGLWVAGYERGQLGSNVDPHGDARGFVHRIVDGAIAETWTVDTSGAEVVEALAFDDDGTPVIAGRTTGNLGQPTFGGYDGFLARLEAGGGLGQVLQFGSQRPQHPRALVEMDDGWLVAGYDDIYIPANYVESWGDPFVAIVTDDLSAGSFRTWQSDTDDYLWDAVAAPGGDAFFEVWNGAGATRGPHVSRRAMDGEVMWTHRLTQVSVDGVAAVQVAASGEVVVAGSTFALLGDRQYGGADVFVAFLDPATGTPRRYLQFGSHETDWATDMVVTADGRVQVAGVTDGNLAAPAAGDFDLFVLTFGANGELEDAWQHGTDGEEHAAALAVDGTGRVFVAGYTTGSLAAPGAGGRDAIVVQVR